MAKQKKPHHVEIPPSPGEAIGVVRGGDDFLEPLRRELACPIPMNP